MGPYKDEFGFDDDDLVKVPEEEQEVAHLHSPWAESWVHLLDAAADPELEHYLVAHEIFLTEPEPYDDQQLLKQWGDRILNIVAIGEVRVIVESRDHWRVEVDITSAGGLIPVLQVLELVEVEWVKSFPISSWRTERVTIVRHSTD